MKTAQRIACAALKRGMGGWRVGREEREQPAKLRTGGPGGGRRRILVGILGGGRKSVGFGGRGFLGWRGPCSRRVVINMLIHV